MRSTIRLFVLVAAAHFALSYIMFAVGNNEFVTHLYPGQGPRGGFLEQLLIQPFWGARAVLPLPESFLFLGRSIPAALVTSCAWGVLAAFPFWVARTIGARVARVQTEPVRA